MPGGSESRNRAGRIALDYDGVAVGLAADAAGAIISRVGGYSAKAAAAHDAIAAGSGSITEDAAGLIAVRRHLEIGRHVLDQTVAVQPAHNTTYAVAPFNFAAPQRKILHRCVTKEPEKAYIFRPRLRNADIAYLVSVAVKDATELVNRCPQRSGEIDIRRKHVVGRRVVADDAQLLGRADLDVAVVVFVKSLPLRYAHRIVGQNRRFFVLPAGKDIPFLRRARPVVSRDIAREDIVLLVKYRSVLVLPANRAVVAAVLSVAEPHQVFKALVRLAVNGNGYRPAYVHRIKTISAGHIATDYREAMPTLGSLPLASGHNVIGWVLQNPAAVDLQAHVVVVALAESPLPRLLAADEEPAIEPHLRHARHHALGILAVGVILVKDLYRVRLAGCRVVLDRIVPAEPLAAVGHGAPRYGWYDA